MAARVVWSARAQRERFEISNIGLTVINPKLQPEALSTIRIGMKKVAEMPETEIPTENPDVKIKIIKDYLIYYHISAIKTIEVLTIWDSRRNPKKFKL